MSGLWCSGGRAELGTEQLVAEVVWKEGHVIVSDHCAHKHFSCTCTVLYICMYGTCTVLCMYCDVRMLWYRGMVQGRGARTVQWWSRLFWIYCTSRALCKKLHQSASNGRQIGMDHGTASGRSRIIEHRDFCSCLLRKRFLRNNFVLIGLLSESGRSAGEAFKNFGCPMNLFYPSSMFHGIIGQ